MLGDGDLGFQISCAGPDRADGSLCVLGWGAMGEASCSQPILILSSGHSILGHGQPEFPGPLFPCGKHGLTGSLVNHRVRVEMRPCV